MLVPGRFVIGRTTDNDMQVDSKFVSRHHMQLVTTLDGCVVEDLNSTNGVYLNGKRVRRHRLQPGDVIKLGMHDLTYTRADLPEDHEDPRATQTTVLRDGGLRTRTRTRSPRATTNASALPIRPARAGRNPPAWRGNRAGASTAAPPASPVRRPR